MKNAINEEDAGRFTASGMAAYLPGMQFMVELMQRQLDEFKRELALFQDAGAPPKKKLGRPLAKPPRASGWPEDEAERKVEMARRQAVAAAKKKNGGKAAKAESEPRHPRDPRHPGHTAWLAKIKKAQKKYWSSLSPAQQKARAAKMTKGRSDNARTAVEELRATA